jgi:hypothetical protein
MWRPQLFSPPVKLFDVPTPHNLKSQRPEKG